MATATEVHISTEEAIRYLNIYLGHSDWEGHLKTLWSTLVKRHKETEAKSLMRKIIACSIMLVDVDRSKATDVPENLLFWCQKYHQFNEEDWVSLLVQRMQEDKQIEEYRNQCLSLGVVHPLEYSPVTRQAFNWLYGKAEDTGAVTESNKKDMIRRFQNLVYAYGGNVICYIFMKEEFKINKKVLNWRTNYFFERLIFDVYTVEQVLKIKKQELNKTNAKLVKKIRTD